MLVQHGVHRRNILITQQVDANRHGTLHCNQADPPTPTFGVMSVLGNVKLYS